MLFLFYTVVLVSISFKYFRIKAKAPQWPAEKFVRADKDMQDLVSQYEVSYS